MVPICIGSNDGRGAAEKAAVDEGAHYFSSRGAAKQAVAVRWMSISGSPMMLSVGDHAPARSPRAQTDTWSSLSRPKSRFFQSGPALTKP